jgi:hypothetical protein
MDGNCDNHSGVMCCFCNESIKITNIDPCDIDILINWDKSKEKQHNQTFWCHLECFREKLHTNIRIHLMVDLLAGDDEEEEEREVVPSKYIQELFKRDFTWWSSQGAAQNIVAVMREQRQLPTEITVDITPLDEERIAILKENLIKVLRLEEKELRTKNIHRLIIVHNSEKVLDYGLLHESAFTF